MTVVGIQEQAAKASDPNNCQSRLETALMTDHKQDELLLDQLRKHGQQFLSLFSFPSPDDKKKRKRPEEHLSGYKIARLGVDSGEDEDEWLGFGVQEIDTSKESGDPMEGMARLKNRP